MTNEEYLTASSDKGKRLMNMLPTESNLHDSPLVRDLSEAEIHILFDHMEHLCYESGSLIINQGDENNGLWLLGHGTCEVVRREEKSGQEQILAMLGPGTVFGEMSFFQARPHSADIKAVSQSTVHKISLDSFAKLSQASCQIANTIMRNLVIVLGDRLKMMDHWVCELLGGVESNHQKNRDEWDEFRSKLYTDWDF